MKHTHIQTAGIKPATAGAPRGKARLKRPQTAAADKLPRPAIQPSGRPENLSAHFRHAEERVLGQVIVAAHQPHADAIHDLRVALRRFAELLQTARIAGLIPDSKARRLLRRMRAIRHLGGDVRDIDVLVEIIRTSGDSRITGKPVRPAAASDPQRLKLFRKRECLVRKLRTELRDLISSRYLTMLNRRLTTTGTKALPIPTTNHIWQRVLANRRNLARACQIAAAEGNDNLIHCARIAAKKLRYSCELALQAGVPDLQTVLDQLKKFQKITGDLHDAHLAMEFFASDAKNRGTTEADRVPPRIAARHARLHAAALKELACWVADSKSGPLHARKNKPVSDQLVRPER